MLQQAVSLASNNRNIIDLSKMVTHTYSLDNIEEAMLATEKYYGLRVLIKNRF
jgi:Zn-dependent alcohol dehydrogenase